MATSRASPRFLCSFLFLFHVSKGDGFDDLMLPIQPATLKSVYILRESRIIKVLNLMSPPINYMRFFFFFFLLKEKGRGDKSPAILFARCREVRNFLTCLQFESFICSQATDMNRELLNSQPIDRHERWARNHKNPSRLIEIGGSTSLVYMFCRSMYTSELFIKRSHIYLDIF